SRKGEPPGPTNPLQQTPFPPPLLFGGFGSERRLVLRAQFLHNLPIRVAGKPLLIEEQYRATANKQVGRVFERGGRVVQNTRRLIDIVAGIQDTIADLQFAGDDVSMSTGEMLVRRR